MFETMSPFAIFGVAVGIVSPIILIIFSCFYLFCKRVWRFPNRFCGTIDDQVEGEANEQQLQASSTIILNDPLNHDIGNDDNSVVTELPKLVPQLPQPESYWSVRGKIGDGGWFVLTPDDPTCAICHEDYCVGSYVKILPCMHRFHEHCIDQAVRFCKHECPICRMFLLDPPKPSL